MNKTKVYEWRRNIIFIPRDVSQDWFFEQANIQKAKYLITALPNNVDNLFIVLYTWNLNKELLTVNRLTELEDQTKIKSDEVNQIITQFKISTRSY